MAQHEKMKRLLS